MKSIFNLSKGILSVALISVAFASCSEDTMDNINKDKDHTTSVPAKFILADVITATAFSNIGGDFNTYYSTYVEHMVGVDNQLANAEKRNGEPSASSTFNNVWGNLYSTLKNARIAINISSNEVTGNYTTKGIGEVLAAINAGLIADSFGDTPFSQAALPELANGQPQFLTPELDKQEAIYTAIMEYLDAAITDLPKGDKSDEIGEYDFIYKGDVKKWIRFANSLKLRLALRIAYANPVKAQQMAEEAVNPANGGVIESNADNATWNYFETSQNPIYVATRYNQVQTSDHGGVPCLTGGDTHAAADIICYMNGYKDNRREKFFTKSEWAGQDYVGMRRGIVIPELKTTGHKYSGVNIAPTSPLYWMNAAEVAFLRAEGQAVFNFSMGGTAESFYNQGIRLSFEQWGADGVEDYLKDDVNKPTAYTDPAGTNTYQNALSNITIKWNDSADKEEKQERIIVQKWIANWQLGNEAWADFRRTGYPKLIPVKENKSGGVVDSEKGARRMPYPLDEFVSNKANVEYAIANYLHGADNMATDVWWASKK